MLEDYIKIIKPYIVELFSEALVVMI